MGLEPLGSRVAGAARGPRGAAPARHRPGGGGRPQGPPRGPPGVLAGGRHVVSGGPERGLPRGDDVGAPRPAGAPPLAPRRTPARSGLRASGAPEATGQAADAQPAGCAGRRAPAAPGPPAQHGLGRTRALALASGLGPLGASDVQLLSSPRAPAAAGRPLPGLLHYGSTAHALAAPVATARASRPRRASAPLARAHTSAGRRADGARLDLA